eukprot:jgi/Mesen1/5904/ME000030S05167
MSSVTTVYLHVIDDVIKNARADFQSEGVDESVLHELQALWELKLVQSGAINGPQAQEGGEEEAGATGGGVTQDLNAPAPGQEEYPTRDLLSSAGAGGDDQAGGNADAEEDVAEDGDEDEEEAGEGDVDTQPALGRPQPYMAAPEKWEHKPAIRVDMNLLPADEADEGADGDEHDDKNGEGDNNLVTQDFFSLDRKRKYDNSGLGSTIPQQDGASDCHLADRGCLLQSSRAAISCQGEEKEETTMAAALAAWQAAKERMLRLSSDAQEGAHLAAPQRRPAAIPQLDGEYDDEEAEEEEDYNEPAAAEADALKGDGGAGAKDEGNEEDEELGENDDDDDLNEVNDDDDGDGPATSNLVLSQYDKVTRTKNKWKCTLKDGIMHLGGRDFVFVKATGEFEF